MTEDALKIEASLRWLMENYSHIWFNTDLDVTERAGFLAAVCNPHRCYLMTLSLKERVRIIRAGIWDHNTR